MRLRGRGRVRQGVCPFHDEAEGSFTVYADSERFYCFGCGLGGDVLDFVQRSEGLTLTEAIARLDGSPGLAPRAAFRPAGARRPASAAPASKGPLPADGGGALLRRLPPAFDRSAGIPGLAGRRPGRRRPPLLSAMRRAAVCDRPLSPWASPRSGSRDSGLFMERGAERFAGMVVVPDASGGLVRWLKGRALDSGAKPRFQALPGPKPVLGLGRLGPAPPWTVVTEGLFDWLLLSRVGPPLMRRPGHPGRGAGRLRPPGLRPRLPRLRRRRRGPGGDGAASDPARTQGRRGHPPTWHRRRGRVGRSAPGARRLPAPTLAGRPLRPLAAPRRSSSGLRFPSLTPPPLSPPRRTYAHFTTGLARARIPVEGTRRSLIRYRNEHTEGDTTCSATTERTTDTPSTSTGRSKNGNGHKPGAAIPAEHELALGRALARSHPGARPAHRPRAGLPAQGARRQDLRLPRRARRHRPGQPHLRIRRLGIRAGRRRDPAPGRDGRSPRPGEVKTALGYSAPVRVTVAGALPRTDVGVHPVHGGQLRRARHRHQGRGHGRHEAGVPQLRAPVREWLLRRPVPVQRLGPAPEGAGSGAGQRRRQPRPGPGQEPGGGPGGEAAQAAHGAVRQAGLRRCADTGRHTEADGQEHRRPDGRRARVAHRGRGQQAQPDAAGRRPPSTPSGIDGSESSGAVSFPGAAPLSIYRTRKERW